jgi:5-methylcytosine-specific restriction protein A
MFRKSPDSVEWIRIDKNPQHVSREKLKARELKHSNWWKNEIRKGICHYCGKKFDPKQLTMDHIVPLSRGGLSNRKNVVPCCKDCNNKKKHLTPAEITLQKLRNGQKT